jgi:hypothetical protein
MIHRAPNVILRGGPVQVTEAHRLRHVTDIETTLKIPLGHAYEHFRPTPETVEHEKGWLRVFEWTRRTYVAE